MANIALVADGWIELSIAGGAFNVAQAGYGNLLTKTTATGKFRAKLVN